MYLLICLMAILITHGSRLYLEQVLATTHLKKASLKVVGRIPLIDGLVRLDGVWLHSIFAPDSRRKWWWFPRAAVVHIRTWESMCWRRRSRCGAVEVGKSSGRKTLRVGKLTSSSRLLHGIILFFGAEIMKWRNGIRNGFSNWLECDMALPPKGFEYDFSVGWRPDTQPQENEGQACWRRGVSFETQAVWRVDIIWYLASNWNRLRNIGQDPQICSALLFWFPDFISFQVPLIARMIWSFEPHDDLSHSFYSERPSSTFLD